MMGKRCGNVGLLSQSDRGLGWAWVSVYMKLCVFICSHIHINILTHQLLDDGTNPEAGRPSLKLHHLTSKHNINSLSPRSFLHPPSLSPSLPKCLYCRPILITSVSNDFFKSFLSVFNSFSSLVNLVFTRDAKRYR